MYQTLALVKKSNSDSFQKSNVKSLVKIHKTNIIQIYSEELAKVYHLNRFFQTVKIAS